MTGILFLAHRLPFPPDRGDRIRSHHILHALSRIAPVHLGCLLDDAADRLHLPQLAGLVVSSCTPVRRKPLSLAGLEALMRGQPVSLAAFRNRALAQWVERLLRSGEISTVYVFSGQMGQYVPPWWRGRVVVDLVDVDSAKFDAYAASGKGPMRLVHAREGRLLRAEEARLAAQAAQTLLISEAEAELLRSRLPPGIATSVTALGNGIDADVFNPAAVPPHPAMGQGPHLIFTGQMDYAPNVAAVERAVERIMPQIRAVHPQAQFHIVGRAPVPQVAALHGRNGCCVWGAVPDVRPFLAGADIVLAPLTIARGVQNKVLEAMAMARPVVLSPEAATGIAAQDGTHFRIGHGDGELAAHVLALLHDGAEASAMGEAARHFVMDRMSWAAMLRDLPALIDPAEIMADAA